MTTEEMNEIKADMRQDMLKEAAYKDRMYNDWEFAVDQFSSEIEEAYEILQSVSYKLSKYNHEIPAKDLLNYIL